MTKANIRVLLTILAVFFAPWRLSAEIEHQIGDLAKITVGRNMSVSIEVDLTKRQSIQAIATTFLARSSGLRALTRGNKLVVPFDRLADPLKAIVAMRLWPGTRVLRDGLRHQVALRDESEAGIAAVFTGDRGNARLVRKLGTVAEIRVELDNRIWLKIKVRTQDRSRLASALLTTPSKAVRMTARGVMSIPFGELRTPYRAMILHHLFPDDEMRADALRHRVQLGVETLGRLAAWYTGNRANWRKIKRASNKRSDQIAKRETIKIPTNLLAAWGSLTEAQIAQGTSDFPLVLRSVSRQADLSLGRFVTIASRHLAPWTSLIDSTEDRAMDQAKWFVYAGQRNPPLTYKFDREGGYAEYRLKRGEALYTAVAIRFAGVQAAPAVRRMSSIIQKRSGIRDVTSIPVGAAIKIPMDVLLPEWRPKGDPRRVMQEAEEQEVQETIRQIEREVHHEWGAKPLKGVVVILDAGHGGRDPGKQNTHLKMNENEYAYDIMCRIKRLLARRTDAQVFVTIEDRRTGYTVSDRSIIRDNNDEQLLTNPRYANRDPRTSAHLRWALANSIFRRVVRQGINSDNVVFTSVHINSLHRSQQGVMAFIPSAHHTAGNRNFNRNPYKRYREVRQKPVISFTRKQRRRSQAASRRFAEMYVGQCRRQGVSVLGRKPIRSYIVPARGGRPFVPAVLRYNAVPNKQLLELVNLNSRRDAVRLQDHNYREKAAIAYVDALIQYYGG